jgi:polar amino acid transport system substrate-binding protein
MSIELLCWLVFVSSSALAEPIKIVCNDWKPYIDTKDKDGGIVTELVTEAFSRAGITATPTVLPVPRAIKNLLAGDLQAYSCAWYNEERDKKFLFSEPFLANRVFFMKRRDREITWTSLRDLKDFTFVVLRSAAYDEKFINATYLKKIFVNRLDLNLKMVLQGRADLTPMDHAEAKVYLSALNPEESALLDFVEKPLGEHLVYVMVPRNLENHKEIIRKFNQGMAELRRDGTYDRILKKYDMYRLRYPYVASDEGGSAEAGHIEAIPVQSSE